MQKQLYWNLPGCLRLHFASLPLKWRESEWRKEGGLVPGGYLSFPSNCRGSQMKMKGTRRGAGIEHFKNSKNTKNTKNTKVTLLESAQVAPSPLRLPASLRLLSSLSLLRQLLNISGCMWGEPALPPGTCKLAIPFLSLCFAGGPLSPPSTQALLNISKNSKNSKVTLLDPAGWLAP